MVPYRSRRVEESRAKQRNITGYCQVVAWFHFLSKGHREKRDLITRFLEIKNINKDSLGMNNKKCVTTRQSRCLREKAVQLGASGLPTLSESKCLDLSWVWKKTGRDPHCPRKRPGLRLHCVTNVSRKNTARSRRDKSRVLLWVHTMGPKNKDERFFQFLSWKGNGEDEKPTICRTREEHQRKTSKQHFVLFVGKRGTQQQQQKIRSTISNIWKRRG